MNFSEVKFYGNYLTSDSYTNTVISRRVCIPVKMASETVTRSTVESRFLEPPREKKNLSRNRKFEKSRVASNDAKLLRYCLVRDNYSHFRSNRCEMADLSLAVS